MSHLAGSVKVNWAVDVDSLVEHGTMIAKAAARQLERDGVPDTPPTIFNMPNPSAIDQDVSLRTLTADRTKLLLKNSISSKPLHKALVLLDAIRDHHDHRFQGHELVALAKTLVFSASNLHFGPEVGLGTIRDDAAVIDPWLSSVKRMAADIRTLADRASVEAVVHHADARHLTQVIDRKSINAVITSPPYPNEKDYTRTTRLESIILGLIEDKLELRQFKKNLIRSNTRGVYKDDNDDQWISSHPEVQRIADEIEARRIELGKTSGFERMYPRVTKLYFGGMAKHFSDLRSVLRPGAHLAYVVGDQASYLQVMIRTGQLLAEIAEELGYEVVSLDLFRTRIATATREQLREEVVVLRWPG